MSFSQVQNSSYLDGQLKSLTLGTNPLAKLTVDNTTPSAPVLQFNGANISGGGGGGGVSSVATTGDKLVINPTSGAVDIEAPDVLTDKGNWSATVTYSKGDCVEGDLNDKYYISQQDANTNHIPSTDVGGTWWKPFVVGGAGGSSVSSVVSNTAKITVLPTSGDVVVTAPDVMRDQGNYNPLSTYLKGDCVLGDLNDKYYVSQIDANTGNAPSAGDLTKWKPFSSGQTVPLTALNFDTTWSQQLQVSAGQTGWQQFGGNLSWRDRVTAGSAGDYIPLTPNHKYLLTANLSVTLAPASGQTDAVNLFLTYKSGLTAYDPAHCFRLGQSQQTQGGSGVQNGTLMPVSIIFTAPADADFLGLALSTTAPLTGIAKFGTNDGATPIWQQLVAVVDLGL